MNELSRRGAWKLVWLLAAATALVATRSSPAAEVKLAGKRPNIILILTDDQGYGDLGRNGNRFIKTPNLDKFYDEAVHFEDFHVSPTCSPTRSSIMAGRHEFRSGVTHTILERERMTLKATTLAQVLKSAGYATGVFGKWHLGDEAPYQPQRRGFDEVFIHGAGGIGQSYAGSCGDAPKNSYFDPVILQNGTFVKTDGYCTDVFFDQATRWIESRKRQTPFFCYITPNAPHAPLHVPEKYEQMYADIPELAAAKPAGKQPKAKSASQVAKFFGMITNIDDNVGKLLARLKEQGIERDTLVIYMNDNGGTAGCRVWNAGMRGTKGTASNGGTRGMSLWRWPGTLKPGPVAALTAHLDLFPTFVELAGAKIPEATAAKLEGFSLVPLLENPQAKWHDDRMLFTHVGRWAAGAEPVKYGPCSVRWRQYLYFPSRQDGALYDLQADPGETTNIAGQCPDVTQKLAKAYDLWWTETLPCLENETACKTAPKINSFHELYWKQFKGPGPNNATPPDRLP
jgi:arylsulfatase